MDRRTFLGTGGQIAAAGSIWLATSRVGVYAAGAADPLRDEIARIEQASRGRLGVALHDTGTGLRFAYRGGEEFPMLSTVKLLLAGATLARVQQGRQRLDRRFRVSRDDAFGWSPFTERRAGTTATLAELCRAMTVESDNGAAQLLLADLGGIPALSAYLRSIGDRDTLAALKVTGQSASQALLQAEQATATPLAMQANAERLWLGSALAPVRRAQLVDWAVGCRTGRTRLRAGVPAGWRVGNKTGTGEDGTYNDVAVVWPPRRKPVIVASYLTGSRLEADAANAIHAQVARALVRAI